MAFASFATALRAWVQHFGWTGAPAVLFGLVASEIRPDKSRLDDAALELRRALINNQSRRDTDAAAREMPVARPSPFGAGPAAASAIISEASARDTDVIVAVTRDAMAAALREAFDTGRADNVSEGLDVSQSFRRPLRGLAPVRQRPVNQIRFGIAVRKQFWLGFGNFRKPTPRELPRCVRATRAFAHSRWTERLHRG